MDRHRRLNHLMLSTLLALTMTACGGGGGADDDGSGQVPLGGPLPDVQFRDSESYHPLDKVDANGVFIPEDSPAFGPRNPLRQAGDATLSAWAIDASAESPNGLPVEYAMVIEPLTADGTAYNSLLTNLRLDQATGLIYQQCRGYPTCYDNNTGQDQEFRITAIARVAGSGRALERSFIFRVLAD
jgi:hypothetical protein